MVEIIPAIIAENFDELKKKIKLVEPYVKAVQIDVMDGIFAPNKNWPCSAETSAGKNEPVELKNIETNLDLEVHLMVENPEEEIDKWLDSGVKRILAHWEALFKSEVGSKKLEELIKRCDKQRIEFGLVLNLETPIGVLDEIIMNLSTGSGHNNNLLPEQVRSLADASNANIDVIQLMSIRKIGHYGEKFDEKVIHKIGLLRRKYPDVKIEVDGGINQENAPKIAEAGADVLVVGSAVFNSKNIKETIGELKKVLK